MGWSSEIVVILFINDPCLKSVVLVGVVKWGFIFYHPFCIHQLLFCKENFPYPTFPFLPSFLPSLLPVPLFLFFLSLCFWNITMESCTLFNLMYYQPLLSLFFLMLLIWLLHKDFEVSQKYREIWSRMAKAIKQSIFSIVHIHWEVLLKIFKKWNNTGIRIYAGSKELVNTV